MKALVNSGKGHIKEHVRVCIITKNRATVAVLDYCKEVIYWDKREPLVYNISKLAGKAYSCIILDGEFTQEEIEFINTRCK